MYVLTETEFRAVAEPALRQVFVDEDAFAQPFSPNVAARRIVYPCSQYIEPPLADAILKAASNLGDTGCYLVDLWAPGETDYFYIPFSEFVAVYFGSGASDKSLGYQTGRSLSSESILYSPQGLWGVLISHEWHGMLGGATTFIKDIYRAIPALDNQVYAFIEKRLRKSEGHPFSSTTLKWLPNLLVHTYGRKQAEKIMQDVGIYPKYWGNEKRDC